MDKDYLDGMSLDTEKTERDKLKAVFPECFSEGKLDIDKLLTMCGEYITNDFEKYKFEWKGKSESLILGQKRSTGTLRPKVEESVNFDETQNLYIKGDNLEVIKLLQTSYYNKVKMIYIDVPYNTGHDFVYEDDFTDPIERYKFVTSQATRSNPETMGRFHTAWLNMMYPRLRLAATLLREDGVCFISIDDTEEHNLRKLCDETFGEENFVAVFPWRKRTAKSDVPFGVSQDYEWVMCYAKSDKFTACLEGGTRKYYETDDLPNRPWRVHDMSTQRSAAERPNSDFTIINPKNNKEYPVNPNAVWRVTKETFKQFYSENKIVFPGDYDFLKISKPVLRYFKEDDIAKSGDMFGFIPMSTNLPQSVGMSQDGTKDFNALFESKLFGYPKPLELIKHLVKAATNVSKNNNDIILDFFSGSATTAHAVMQLNAEDGGNRQFIMVQLPEVCDEKSEAYKAGYQNICDIGMERIRRAGAKILAEQESQLEIGEEEKPSLDVGFKVFELDTSNLKAWDGTPIKDGEQQILFERMNAMFDNVKPDRSDMDMVYEVMLKMGIPLTYPVLPLDINSKIAYSIGEECLLLVCLAEGVTPEDIIEMCDYAPSKLIIGRNCMKDDSTMSNAYYIMKDRGISWKLI